MGEKRSRIQAPLSTSHENDFPILRPRKFINYKISCALHIPVVVCFFGRVLLIENWNTMYNLSTMRLSKAKRGIIFRISEVSPHSLCTRSTLDFLYSIWNNSQELKCFLIKLFNIYNNFSTKPEVKKLVLFCCFSEPEGKIPKKKKTFSL